jgi:diguanylate cyclase (GGDEF)-like protein
MRSYSITRIGVALTLVVVVTAMTLTTMTWHQAESTALAIEARERTIAREELREVLAGQEIRMRQIGRTLATWDDTRQRLTRRAHYADWRHSPAWTAGLLPCSTDGLALYDPDGHILAPDPSDEAMPARMPSSEMPTFETTTVAGHGHLTFYHPVHDEGDAGQLLGYIGLRIDLLPEVLGGRQYLFVDPGSIRFDVPDGPRQDIRPLVEQASYKLRPSPYREHFMAAFWQVNIRLVVFVLLTVGAIALLLRNAVARPLQAMARDIDDLNSSVDPLRAGEIRAPASRIRELDAVRRSILNYRAHLAEMHRHLQLSAQKFEHQAYHDALTGALNRRAFDEDMDTIGGMRSSDRHALLLFDCDRFKAINDSLGHNVGDDVLRVIACQLQESLRGEDRLYRLGGDEFVTLLPGADHAMALAVAERCLQKTRDINYRRLGMTEPISLSVGIAVDNGEGLPLAELHRRADMAMYKAKQSDVEKVVSHEPAGAPEPDRPD